ncbi:hypothetical protein [Mycobacterium sp.]|uniref:hypothetical protein n=1 Tax=Mycobacterium sp. TaxID=1785 RepID=UPI003F9A11F6
MAELFGDLGYRTACFGKWHVGSAPDRLPNAQGFDEWWGIPNSSDEAFYTQHPLYPKDFPIPMILEGAKGEACKAVEKFDPTTRPFMGTSGSPTDPLISSHETPPQTHRSSSTPASPRSIRP